MSGLSIAGPEFRRWWSEYPVRRFRPAAITVRQPLAGPIELEVFQFAPVRGPEPADGGAGPRHAGRRRANRRCPGGRANGWRCRESVGRIEGRVTLAAGREAG
ncbi:MmyB family transcriptional regulator [Nocardia niigatensis]